MNCFLTSRQKPKLKPSMKAKGKSTQYWSNFSIFFIVEGNYSRAVGNGILVESCWSLELAFSECRPRKLKEEQEPVDVGVGKHRDKCFYTHTNSTTESEYVYTGL